MDGVNYQKGCLMVDFDIPDWNGILTTVVDRKDVYYEEDLGLEMKAHTTVLYGLDDAKVDIGVLKEPCPPILDIKVQVLGLGMFEPNDYDVIKFDVFSNELSELNSVLRDTFEYENEYDDYIKNSL